jgi:transposase-like protein
MGMKNGANFEDQNNIRRFINEGLSSEQISEALNIDLECVESWVEFFADESEESEEDEE